MHLSCINAVRNKLYTIFSTTFYETEKDNNVYHKKCVSLNILQYSLNIFYYFRFTTSWHILAHKQLHCCNTYTVVIILFVWISIWNLLNVSAWKEIYKKKIIQFWLSSIKNKYGVCDTCDISGNTPLYIVTHF